MTKIINILILFLTFISIYNQAKAHNMLAIMLDLCFKNMKVILVFVGNAHVIQIVTNCDKL
jgi:putative heme degradation protein